jgi:hypothetical protein
VLLELLLLKLRLLLQLLLQLLVLLLLVLLQLLLVLQLLLLLLQLLLLQHALLHRLRLRLRLCLRLRLRRLGLRLCLRLRLSLRLSLLRSRQLHHRSRVVSRQPWSAWPRCCPRPARRHRRLRLPGRRARQPRDPRLPRHAAACQLGLHPNGRPCDVLLRRVVLRRGRWYAANHGAVPGRGLAVHHPRRCPEHALRGRRLPRLRVSVRSGLLGRRLRLGRWHRGRRRYGLRGAAGPGTGQARRALSAAKRELCHVRPQLAPPHCAQPQRVR